MPSLVLDRHLFASNASAYNAAWESYGWTAGLTRARAGRLEERVPWAAGLAELADPPVLIDGTGCGGGGAGGGGGGAAGHTAGIGTLPEAFLPLDGRLGFSVSGVIRAGDGASAPGGRLRTATHTVLFDEGQFEAMDGYPQGLHVDLVGSAGHSGDRRLGGAPPAPRARWFIEMGRSVPLAPGPLPELECSPDRARLRAARLREVGRLVEVAGVSMGRRDVRRQLEEAYRAVGTALDGGPGCVVVSAPEDTGSGLLAAALVRLAWLSLPLADRRRVYYATTSLGGRRPEPCLTVGPGLEGGPGRGAAGAPWRAETPAGERIRHWAEMVLGGGGDLARVAKRMDVRGMSLFEGRSSPYIVYGARGAPRWVDVAERVRVEAEGAGRWRGLGWAVAGEVRRNRAAPGSSWVEALLADPRLAHNPAFFDGVARGLSGHVSGPEAARFAVVAGVRCGRRPRGLALVVEGLRVLVRSGGPPEEVGAVIRSVEDRDGPEAAAEMTRIGIGLLRLAGRVSEVPVFFESLRNGVRLNPSVTADLATVAEDWLARSGEVEEGWRSLLRRAWSGAAAEHRLDIGAMHRLAWLEYRARGAVTLADLVAERDPGAAHLARRLMDREPDPPLSVFLALRGALAEGTTP